MGDASGAKRGPGRPAGNHRLVVWGERRDRPDWDLYIAALLSYSLTDAGVPATTEEVLAINKLATRADERRGRAVLLASYREQLASALLRVGERKRQKLLNS